MILFNGEIKLAIYSAQEMVCVVPKVHPLSTDPEVLRFFVLPKKCYDLFTEKSPKACVTKSKANISILNATGI